MNLKDMPPLKRRNFLESADEVVAHFRYSIPITEEEYQELESQYTAQALKISEAQKAKKELVKMENEKIKLMQRALEVLVDPLTTRHKSMVGRVYKFVEDGEAIFYNENGDEVYRRTAMPSECQLTINSKIRENG